MSSDGEFDATSNVIPDVDPHERTCPDCKITYLIPYNRTVIHCVFTIHHIEMGAFHHLGKCSARCDGNVADSDVKA